MSATGMQRSLCLSLAPTICQHVAVFAPERCYRCRQLSQLIRRARNVSLASRMHAIEGITPSQTFGTQIKPCFHFTPEQVANAGKQPRLADLVVNKTQRGEFFYGIEITALSRGVPTCVDFNKFLPVLPTFITIAWLAPYWKVEPICQVETLQLIRALESYIPAMPHLSVYHQAKERFDQFFDLKFDNLLAVRGDDLHEGQDYCYTRQLLDHARRSCGKEMSIAVAGHPEGYANNLELGPQVIDTNLTYLKEKIDHGADFIITQICYTVEPIIKYIYQARSVGIMAPFMVGIVVPKTFQQYEVMEKVSKVRMPDKMRAEVAKLKDDDEKVKNFFVQSALNIIEQVLDANLGMHGVQFYTMNTFEPVLEVLAELRKRGILKEPSTVDVRTDAYSKQV